MFAKRRRRPLFVRIPDGENFHTGDSQRHQFTYEISPCGVKGITIEHLIPILTLLDNVGNPGFEVKLLTTAFAFFFKTILAPIIS